MFGAKRCLFGSNFPIEKLWTSYEELVDAHADAAAQLPAADAAQPAARHRDARLSPRLNDEQDRRGNAMALEIKILDYGDIELESSFLVLGRDCGRTRRVPTFGFLILGGTWPVRGRYRLPLEPDHGNARHARAAVPREHDREPARAPRRAPGRHPLRAAHAPAHRSRRQGRPVPDEHHRGRQPARARIFGVGPDAPAISRCPTSST